MSSDSNILGFVQQKSIAYLPIFQAILHATILFLTVQSWKKSIISYLYQDLNEIQRYILIF